MLDHVEQVLAVLFLLDHAQRTDSGAQRCERVLDLVRDVGRELLVAVDPVVKPLTMPRRAPDRRPISSGRAVRSGIRMRPGQSCACVSVAADFGGVGKVGDRVGDGRGQHEAEPDGDQRGDDEHLKHALALARTAASISAAPETSATVPRIVSPCRIGEKAVEQRVPPMPLRGRTARGSCDGSPASIMRRTWSSSMRAGYPRTEAGEQARDAVPDRS